MVAVRGAFLVTMLTLLGCGAAAHPAASGRLLLRVEPLEASVTLDDEFVGRGPRLLHNVLVTTPGKHRLSVTARGYFPHDFEIDLPPGTTKASVKLRAIPQ